ncbi:MAG: hypothetical protein KDD34_04500 [Bdellovibrionales bacterium]|nr:hypothetical protein [Bdellovibrionales bacterium]
MRQQRMQRAYRISQFSPANEYSQFDVLDGTHPWQKAMPENCILYSARQLNSGKIAWFNYNLAKEMGLLPQDHPHVMNKKLELKLLETFCIRIINEFDQENNISYPQRVLKKHKYMATRYLQLQHDDKTGKTSGDGRCVWNGIVKNKGVTWDVSSRGTGVTSLAPGAVQAGRPLESGNTDFGYGCGLAEIDELYGSAIMSEIMHENSINTERMLAIVDTGNSCGIGVRASKNLFRPAHLFMYLKQNNYDALKRATDFLIDRQNKNGDWDFSVKYKSRYRLFLEEICESFAQFAAQLEREYIFAWLDWDGDNVLATAGIIDYGSVRQFGLRHDQYRYDDDDRFSTNLNEQKAKAKLTIQVFAQLVDYLQTKIKKPLAEFKQHPILEKFDRYYDYYLKDQFLYQVGFRKNERELLLNKNLNAVEAFFKEFSFLEKMKTYKKIAKVADGVNRPAIYNMRNFLREFPIELFIDGTEVICPLDERETFNTIISDTASRRDSRMNSRTKKHIHDLQYLYIDILKKAFHGKSSLGKELQDLRERALTINQSHRVTGNALINIVDEIMKSRSKGAKHSDLQKVMDDLVQTQIMRPGNVDPDQAKKLHQSLKQKKLGRVLLTLVDGHREDI